MNKIIIMSKIIKVDILAGGPGPSQLGTGETP